MVVASDAMMSDAKEFAHGNEFGFEFAVIIDDN